MIHAIMMMTIVAMVATVLLNTYTAVRYIKMSARVNEDVLKADQLERELRAEIAKLDALRVSYYEVARQNGKAAHQNGLVACHFKNACLEIIASGEPRWRLHMIAKDALSDEAKFEHKVDCSKPIPLQTDGGVRP